MFETHKIDENYFLNASCEDLKNSFDIDLCSIFSDRDTEKEQVEKITSWQFKSIVSGDDFLIPGRLYEPKNADKNIILYFHGGGWVRGSIDSDDCLCRKLANALSTRVISIEYRLAPRYKFPVALNDAFSAYCGLFDDKKIDFDKVILSGNSAGGTLCAAICIKLEDVKFGSLPGAQILFYPSLSNDLESNSVVKFGKELSLTKSMMKWFVYTYTGKEPDDIKMMNNKLLYPVLQDDMSVFPKTLIVSAERDILFDGQALFLSKLQKCNIKSNQLIVNGASHGFMTYGKNHSKHASFVLSRLKKSLEEL